MEFDVDTTHPPNHKWAQHLFCSYISHLPSYILHRAVVRCVPEHLTSYIVHTAVVRSLPTDMTFYIKHTVYLFDTHSCLHTPSWPEATSSPSPPSPSPPSHTPFSSSSCHKIWLGRPFMLGVRERVQCPIVRVQCPSCPGVMPIASGCNAQSFGCNSPHNTDTNKQ